MRRRVSIVILTLNEELSIGRCLRALANQTDQRFETIIVDAASKDATLSEAKRVAGQLHLPVRIHADQRLLPIGEARNLGATMARTDAVAYLSADAELSPQWVESAIRHLQHHDMVFGSQLHAPDRWTAVAGVRGLRYHFVRGEGDPLRFASNVAGVYRKTILQKFPFDDDSDAAEDLVVAKMASEAGFTAVYDPQMTVLHHDVTRHKEEMRKVVREGQGWARYQGHLGTARGWLAWGGALAVTAIVARRPVGLAAFAGVLWAPALRRAMRRYRHMPWPILAKAILITPVYDLAFLAHYVRRMGRRA